MDFEDRRDPELEAFRLQVSAWLELNAPSEVRMPLESALHSEEVLKWAPEFQRRLADKGWAAPSWPCEYGGQGLTLSHDIIVRDELYSHNIPQLYEVNRQVASAIMAWGASRQKHRFLKPLLKGEVTAWRPLNCADAIADPEAVNMRAEKDGDHYIVSGAELFFGGPGWATYLWTIAVTDPSAQAHRRLSAFLIPTDLPGIDPTSLGADPGRGQNAVALDAVPVPREYLVGGEGNGWLVAQSALDVDSEADRTVKEHQAFVNNFVRLCKEDLHDHQPPRKYENARELAAESHINAHVLRLLSLRNQWMQSTHQPATFQGAQYYLIAKNMRSRLASAMLEVMGPFAVLDDPEWAPMNGEMEALQRTSLPGIDPNDGIAAQQRLIRMSLGLHNLKQEDGPAS